MGRKQTGKTSLGRILAAKGMTLAQLAELTGIPRGTLTSASGGFQKLTPERVAIVAEALHCTPGELADVTGAPKKHTNNGSTAHLAPRKEPEVKLPEPKMKPKPYAEKDEDVEKLWLYFHNMNRRVMTLEAEVKALKEGK